MSSRCPYRSYGSEFAQATILNKSVQRFQGKHFATCGIEQFPHILTPYSKATTTNTGNHLEFRLLWWLSKQTQCAKMLDPCHFITGCSVIFRNFRFDNDLRIVLTWDNEIGSLIKTRDTRSAFRFAETDTCVVQYRLYRRLHIPPDQL